MTLVEDDLMPATEKPPNAAERTPVRGPRYLQIADDLRIQIETGGLKAGDELPSLAALAKKYEVSQAVARQAITLLRAQALITTRQGARPTVRGHQPRITRSNQHHQLEKRRVLEPESVRRDNGALEDTTGISVHDVSLRVDYSRTVADESVPEFPARTPLLRREYETTDERGRRIAWSVSYLPVAMIEPNPALLDPECEPWPGGIQHQLSTVGIEVAEVVDVVTARAPSTVETERWDMPPGEPLLIAHGVMRDPQGQVVSAARVQYPASRTQLEFVTPLPPFSAEEKPGALQ